MSDDNTETSVSSKIVYVLHHPSSSRIYIGQSSKGLKRPRQHGMGCYLRSCAASPRTKWIRALRERGFDYEITVLEVCRSKAELDEAECFYISYFRSLNIPLLNLTDGGDGTVGYVFTPEHCLRISKALSGCVREPDFGVRISKALTGKPRSAEVRAGIAAAAKQRWDKIVQTESGRDHMRRMTKRAKEVWADPKRRTQLLANCAARRPRSVETRAKLSASLQGKVKSLEHREKLRQALKERWADPTFRETSLRLQREGREKKRAKTP
ncbi:MAG TPA: GIY-YIG nuclease family protein [Vicinamibacterales bacterium]|nr:GIY-YIG nuclease family protein [Vicinamibacterales bacterium]